MGIVVVVTIVLPERGAQAVVMSAIVGHRFLAERCGAARFGNAWF